MKRTILFHRTTEETAAKILLAGGFRDSKGNYGTTKTYRGVWFSNVPLDANEGAIGNVLFRVELACDVADLRRWEWIEEGKGYREWLIPARTIKRYLAGVEFDVEAEPMF